MFEQIQKIIQRLRGLRGPVAAAAVMALCLLALPGCERAKAAAKAADQADKQVTNYAKNQRLLHTAEQKAYSIEAKAHIDTKYLWQMEGVQRKAESDKTITPGQIVSETKRLTFLRDDLRGRVDEKVAAVQRLVVLTERDLEGFYKLEAGLKRYDAEEGFDFGSILNVFKPGPSADVAEPVNVEPAAVEGVFVDPSAKK